MTLPDLVLWCGPVYGPGNAPASKAGGDIGRVAWQGPKPEIITLSGNGSSYFSQLAASYADGASGRILDNLLADHGAHVSDFSQIAVAGFSAAHGLLNPLLGADGDRIDAAILLDSCFESPGASPKSGYASFAALAAAGSRLFVLAGSAGQNAPPLPPTTSGYDCALHAAGAGAASAGKALEPTATPSGLPPPSGALSAGDLWVLDYRDGYQHGDIINKLGVPILQTFLGPYLASASRTATPGHHGSPFPWKLVAIGTLALGAAAGAGVLLARKAA